MKRIFLSLPPRRAHHMEKSAVRTHADGFQIKPCFQDGCKYREMSRTVSSEEDFSALSEQENACTCTVETKEGEKKKDIDL